ncbi:hypothetical protein GCM10022631_25750 [Deinococcus rubellus]|uniref:DUF3841 domain-containing protein n=1 Tax=Deinococcus rubellus TaxID=1889240 RepID=UPI0031E90511
MRLYTMQPSTVLANLDAGLTHRPRLDLCERDGFLGMARGEAETRRAYHWMIARLTQQETPPQLDSLPVWAWHTYDPKRPGFDLRVYRPKRPGVLLELEVDPARVLLSDYELWHWALNGWFLGSRANVRAIAALCKKLGVEWGEWWTHPDIAEQVCASWARCLDLKWYAPRWEGKPAAEKSLQGVLWEIRPQDVRRSKVFKGWPRSADGGPVLLWQ